MTRYKRVEEILFVEQDGETALFHPKTNRYYSLEEVATSIWKNLDVPKAKDELVEKILKEYEVTVSECEGDVVDFLKELLEENLIEICD